MPPRENLKRKRSEVEGEQETTANAVAEVVPDAVETFGQLSDGLQFDPEVDNEESLLEFRRAYQLRRDLAELCRRPEGFRFSWTASDGHTHSAPLLTPPQCEAIQRQDGSWYRVPRMMGDHFPSPYSQGWYKQYLKTYGLPTYFLSSRHLAIIVDDDEAEHLGIANAPSSRTAVIPPHDYLIFQYPANTLWPQPEETVYRLEGLSAGPRANLVRHYPAVGATRVPYNLYVWPQGHIELLSSTLDAERDCPCHSEADVDWVHYNDGSMVPSSYHRESTGLHALSIANQSSVREALVQAAINEHAIVNPMEDVPGLGELSYSSEWDRIEAERRGYGSPYEVSLARRRGDLAVGTGTNAGPIVVFRPEPEMLNPREQPSGPGAWHFLTSDGDSSNAGLAAIQFGGSHGLPAYPSARQIRRLGELFRQDGRTDLTEQINVVWVPGAEDAEGEVDPVLDDGAEPEEEMSTGAFPAPNILATKSSPILLAAQSSPNLLESSPNERQSITGLDLICDPTNGVQGGIHDQTGEWAEYQTKEFRSRTITIDRSRAWYNHPEPHKFWCYGSRGWRKWGRWQDMDWKDRKSVNDLNKHREQTHQRAGWPSLRSIKRVDYRPEERQFVMDVVKAVKGNRAKIQMGKLTDEFRRRFPHRSHSATGMQSLVDRLRKEYALYGGLVDRKKRGWKQQQESRASRGGDQVVDSAGQDEDADGKSDDGGGGDDGGDGE